MVQVRDRALTWLTGSTAVCALAGGVAWAGAAVVHSLQPAGCVEGSCGATAATRGSTPLTEVLLLLAAALLVAGLGGLWRLAHRRRAADRVDRVAALLVGVGAALLLAGVVTSATVGGGRPGTSVLVVPGLLAVMAGLAVVAAIVWRARVLPAALSVSLLFAALLLRLADDQTSAILLAVPFGVVWAAVGLVLLRGGQPAAPAARARPFPVRAQ